MGFVLRNATLADVAFLEELIAESARGLSAGHYTPTQIDAALGGALEPDKRHLSNVSALYATARSANSAPRGPSGGIAPAPERGKRMSWSAFLRAHWGAIAAMSFFTVEALTLHGLVR